MLDQNLWQLQNAIDTAARNLGDHVAVADWPAWLRRLVVALDTGCQENGGDADAMLLAVRDVIDERLPVGKRAALRPARARLHRAGLGAALLALWLVWTTNAPDLALWALFVIGLVVYVIPWEAQP